MGNTGTGGQLSDSTCLMGALLTAGTVLFQSGGLGSCQVTDASPNTVAVFPGTLGANLYPRDGLSSETGPDLAILDFDSLMELDSSGAPVPGTKLTKQQLRWTLLVVNETDDLKLQYDALTADVRFLRITHRFFRTNGTVSLSAGANNQTLAVNAGTVKTNLEVALWPFLAADHLLALTLVVTANSGVTNVATTTSMASPNTTLTTLYTASGFSIFFDALYYASYDLAESVKGVVYSVSQQPSGVYIQLLFSSFDQFVSYDPQFSVLLSNQDGDEGNDESLIFGLTVGLVGGAIFVVGVILLVALGSSYFIHRHINKRTAVNFDHTDNNQDNTL